MLTTPSRRGWLSRDPALAAALLFEENNGHLLFMPSIRPFVLLRHVRKPHPVAVAPTSIGGRGIESNRPNIRHQHGRPDCGLDWPMIQDNNNDDSFVFWQQAFWTTHLLFTLPVTALCSSTLQVTEYYYSTYVNAQTSSQPRKRALICRSAPSTR